MTLNSALEDLRATTLKAICGTLRKMQYLAGLRDSEGNYHHWGLARVHGEQAAGKAIGDEHRLLVSEVLSTPIEGLMADLEECSEKEGVAAEAYLQRLTTGPGLLPTQPGAGTGRHLNSVLRALSSLMKANRDPKPGATPPTA